MAARLEIISQTVVRYIALENHFELVREGFHKPIMALHHLVMQPNYACLRRPRFVAVRRGVDSGRPVSILWVDNERVAVWIGVHRGAHRSPVWIRMFNR